MAGPANSLNITQQGVVYFNGISIFSGIDGSTSGDVLTSNGTGVAPSFQAQASNIGTIAGDTGSITGSSVTIFSNLATVNSGSTVRFNNSGTVSTFSVTDALSNTLIGKSSGNLTLSGASNVGMGINSLTSLASSSNNVAIGSNSLTSLTSGTGSNVAVGPSAGFHLLTGVNNLLLGVSAGGLLNGSESSNIIIGNSGATGESNAIRIGDGLTQTTTYIAGIQGATVAASSPVGINSMGQLSNLGFGTATQVLTSNGAGNSPTWAAAATGTVTSVSGTTNRITSTGGTTPVIDISSSYVGQNSITTLGTVTTGTWNGTAIDLAHGGTNANLTASNGGIFYSTASAGAILAGTATAGQIIRSGASTAPTWSTATYPSAAGVSGNVLTSDGTNWNSSSIQTQTTWTPVLAFGGASVGITYTTQIGFYCKIGQMVTVSAIVTLSAVGSSTGVATISGLPFTTKNTASSQQIIPVAIKGGFTLTSTGWAQLLMTNNSTVGNFDVISITGGQTQLSNTAFSNTSSFIIQGTYISDS